MGHAAMDDAVATDITGFGIVDSAISFSVTSGRTSGSEIFQKESIPLVQVVGDPRSGIVMRGILFSMGDDGDIDCPADGHSKLHVFTVQIQSDP